MEKQTLTPIEWMEVFEMYVYMQLDLGTISDRLSISSDVLAEMIEYAGWEACRKSEKRGIRFILKRKKAAGLNLEVVAFALFLKNHIPGLGVAIDTLLFHFFEGLRLSKVNDILKTNEHEKQKRKTYRRA